MFALIKDWFLRPATVGELAASIKRLLDRGRFDQAQRGLDLHRRRFDFTINDRLADIDA